MVFPALPLFGACLCGAVRIKVTARPLLTVACHCRDCQKFTASAFSLTTMVPSDGLSTKGELITGGLGTPERRHFFCKSCLNFVFSQVKGAEHRINLRTSLLNDASLVAPFVEVMTQDKMPWAQVPAVHSFVRAPASPEELQQLMDAYQAL